MKYTNNGNVVKSTVHLAKAIAKISILVLSTTQGAVAASVIEYSPGFLWWGNKGSFHDYFTDICTTMSFGVCIQYRNLNTYLGDVAADYVGNTDLEGGNGPYGEGDIYFQNANYGYTDWLGFAIPWAGSDECFDLSTLLLTGYCNKTTNRPSSADIIINSWWYYDQYPSFVAWGRKNLAHEVGHLLGMNHNDFDYTFMETDVSLTSPNVLQGFEITWINFNY